jgi:hypothetical protein
MSVTLDCISAPFVRYERKEVLTVAHLVKERKGSYGGDCGGLCGWEGRDTKCVQNFDWETSWKTLTWRTTEGIRNTSSSRSLRDAVQMGIGKNRFRGVQSLLSL